MADLFGKRIDSTYIYVLNSDPNTAIVTNGDGSDIDWDGNKIVLKTGDQTISGVKNFNSIPTVQGLEIVFKSNPLSGLGEGILEMAQNSEGSVIFAGNVNSLDGNYSVILAGNNNSLTGNDSAIGVGTYNDLIGSGSFILAGTQNSLSGNLSFIGAGDANHLTGNSSSINGGSNSKLVGDQSSILAGDSNNISGNRSFIGGGASNSVTGTESLIGGGVLNSVDGSKSAILGGEENLIQNGDFSVIVGGDDNTLINSDNSVIVGGLQNSGSGNFSVVVGGKENEVFGELSVIIGGQSNNIIDSSGSFIAGGTENSIIESDNGVILTPDGSRIDKNTDVVFTIEKSDEISEAGFGANFTKFPFQDIGGVREFDVRPDPWYTFSVEDGFERISSYWSAQKTFDAPVYASILNGLDNNVQSDFSTILNGSGNHLAGANSIVAGINNRASGHNSCILGGTGNTINLSFLTGSSTNITANTYLTSYDLISRNYENYNTIIGGKNNIIGSNKAAERFTVTNVNIGTVFNGECIQNQHSHIFGGEENSVDGIGGFILNGKRNDIHAVTHSLYHEFGFRNTFNFAHDFLIPELSGMEHSDLLRDFNGARQTWESLSSIFSSVRCSTHGQLLSISNSINSRIESGYRGPNSSSSLDSDNYPIFCNISNSLGSLVKAAHYSSIFNGIGNEISQSGIRIRSANSTILNGNRNKILTETAELDATDITNNTYSTILNGRNNTIYGRKSTIINGEENTLHGRTNLIFGEGNTVVDNDDAINYSTADFSFLFGEDNLISGVYDTSNLVEGAGNYVFGKRNQLLRCADSFVIGGTRIRNGGGFLPREDDSKFILSHDIFCFDSYVSLVSGSEHSAINNISNSNLFSVTDSSISNLSLCDVFNLSNSSANNLINSNARSILGSNLNYVHNSELSGITRCSIFNLIESDISNATDSKIQGYNINIDLDLDYSDILGSNINITGSARVERSRIFGEDIDFLSRNNVAVTFKNCDILGDGNTLSGTRNPLSNLLIKGDSNSIKGSSNVFIYGDQINVQDSYKSTFFGNDIETNLSSYSQAFGNDIETNLSNYSQAFGEDLKINSSELSEVFGRNINITGSYSFAFGNDIQLKGNRCLIFGKNIQNLYNQDDCFIFGKNITSEHHGSSVIKDGSAAPSKTKDDNALYLDFRKGTHINVPLWQDEFSGNDSSREGTIMYSGNYLLLFNGEEWRKVETSTI